MSAILKPTMMIRRSFVTAQQGPSKQPTSTSGQPRRIAIAGKPALLAIPLLLSRTSAAFAEEIERVAQAAEEAGRQALNASQVPQWSSVRVPEGVTAPDLTNFIPGSDGVNPLLLLGLVASVAVPALLFQALNPGSKAKSTTPANVLKALAEEPRTQLIDIRSSSSVKEQGTPDLSSTRRRLISLPYTRVVKRDEPEEVVADWGAKLAKLAAVKPDSIVILLDADGKLAAKAVAEIPAEVAGELFYVAGGAAAWEASGEPWKEPGRSSFSLPDFSGLTRSLAKGAGTLKIKGFTASPDGDTDGGAAVSPQAVIAAGGAVLGALLLFNQTGAVLEIVGLGAAANYAYKNFFFAEDRKRTTKQLRELVDRKIAVKDVGQDLQKISSVLLETGEEVAGQVEAKGDDLAKDVKKAADRAADSVGSAAQGVKQDVDEAAGEAKDAVNGAPESADSATEEVKAKAEEAKADAKSWIDSWRSKQQG